MTLGLLARNSRQLGLTGSTCRSPISFTDAIVSNRSFFSIRGWRSTHYSSSKGGLFRALDTMGRTPLKNNGSNCCWMASAHSAVLPTSFENQSPGHTCEGICINVIILNGHLIRALFRCLRLRMALGHHPFGAQGSIGYRSLTHSELKEPFLLLSWPVCQWIGLVRVPRGDLLLVTSRRGHFHSFWKLLHFIFPAVTAMGFVGAILMVVYTTNTLLSAPVSEWAACMHNSGCLGCSPATLRLSPLLFCPTDQDDAWCAGSSTTLGCVPWRLANG